MPGRRFVRKREDFTCRSCGAEVRGTGYTDHCPRCLASMHVDNNPGDRASGCGAMMFPISAEYSRQQYVITYRCSGCGLVKRVKSAKDDNEELMLGLIKGGKVLQ